MKSPLNVIWTGFKRSLNPNKDVRALYHRQRLERLKQDVEKWRRAVKMAEQTHLPERASMMTIFQDTILNGHVIGCMNKRRNMTLLKDYALYNGDEIDDNATKLITNKQFKSIMKHLLDALYFGYSMVNVGDIRNSKLTGVRIVPREYINPENKEILSLPYLGVGVPWEGSELENWIMYADTESETGSTNCGFGLLYPVSYYEILLRNLMGYNADYAEVFGQPLRVGKTTKQGDALDEFEEAVANFGSNPYIIIQDATDEIDFKETIGASSGQGHNVYDNLEQRIEKKISKIILGHSDAMDSTPGRLGAEMGDDNPITKALKEVEEFDNDFLENVINSEVLPKLRSLGIRVPEDVVFGFVNDNEEEKRKQKLNEKRDKVATFAEKMTKAGYELNPTELSEAMEMQVTKKQDSSVEI